MSGLVTEGGDPLVQQRAEGVRIESEPDVGVRLAAVVTAAPVDVRAPVARAPVAQSTSMCAGRTSTSPGRITCATASGSCIGEPPSSG